MRENFYNAYDLEVRNNIASLQKIAMFATILFALLSLGYFIYWLGVISDEVYMEYGRAYFEPLAKFLNLGATGTEIYKNTSIFMLFAIIPTTFIQVLLSKTQETLLRSYYLKQEKERLREQKQAQEEFIHRFDSIQTYSICLSIDYEAKKEISSQNKATLNNAIYQKLANTLISIEPSAKISKNEVMIFTSRNFSKYDTIYDSILAQLSQVKNAINKKFGYKLVPSITTDAFSNNFDTSNIKKQHFEIQTFNFKNRALTTATFAKKYKHLKHNKYAGIPVGEYVYFDRDKTGTYELNIIHKNLEKTLAQV